VRRVLFSRIRAGAVGAAFALVMVTSTARGEDANVAARRVRAQELFESALSDVESGRYEAACPTFAASHEADPKTSTLLNLGSCYESLGRIASAWAAFREAEGLARKIGRADLETAARTNAEGLAPKLVRLTVVVPESARSPGLVVSRDGSKLASAEWGVGIPVDDGEHEMSAEAPGRVPWRARVLVRGESRSVEVPVLEIAPSPPPAAAAPTAPARSVSWWTPARATGVALAGAGAASLITGIVLGFVAKGDYDQARSLCRAVDDCPGDAVREATDARSLANGATVAIVSGAVVAAAGGALIVFAPRPSSPDERGAQAPVRARLSVGPTSLGVVGQW